MKSVVMLLLTWGFGAYAGGDCDFRLAIDHSADAVFINRVALPRDVDREGLLNSVIHQIEPGRPILIYDTNPQPALWAEANIVRPGDDQRFAATSYESLPPQDRRVLFGDFVAHANFELLNATRPILIIDHHFDVQLLANTSATPLTVDFLNWLSAQPSSLDNERVRAAMAHGVAVRDHADADIVLANFAGRLSERPRELERWSPLIRAVALYNDHAQLPGETAEVSRNQVVLGHALLEGFQHYIEEHAIGGYDFTLQHLPEILAMVERAATGPLAHAPDVVDAFLKSDEPKRARLDLGDVFRSVRRAWVGQRKLTLQINSVLDRGREAWRAGDTLVIDLPVAPRAASGLAVARLVEASTAKLARGARTLVLITREPGLKTHVKLRALAPEINFGRVLPQIRELEFGGGGRGRAAGLYSPSGRTVSRDQLRAHVRWLTDRL